MRIAELRALLVIAAIGFAACDDAASSPHGSLLGPEAATTASAKQIPASAATPRLTPEPAAVRPSLAPSAVGSPTAALLQNISVPGGFTVEPLARGGFPDPINVDFRIKLDGLSTHVVHVRDPSDVLVVKLTFQEGGSVGWHTHPGPAIVAVQSGMIGIINAADCVLRNYGAGMAFIDPGQGNVHVGFNAAAGVTVAYVTFLDVPAGMGPTIPASDPGC